MTAAQRQRRFREAQSEKGLQQITVWLHVTDIERLHSLLIQKGYNEAGQKQQGFTQLLGDALKMLENSVTSNRRSVVTNTNAVVTGNGTSSVINNEATVTSNKSSVANTPLHQRISTLRATGLSYQAIADQFNQEGMPTLSGRGQWRKGTVARLLKTK